MAGENNKKLLYWLGAHVAMVEFNGIGDRASNLEDYLKKGYKDVTPASVTEEIKRYLGMAPTGRVYIFDTVSEQVKQHGNRATFEDGLFTVYGDIEKITYNGVNLKELLTPNKPELIGTQSKEQVIALLKDASFPRALFAGINFVVKENGYEVEINHEVRAKTAFEFYNKILGKEESLDLTKVKFGEGYFTDIFLEDAVSGYISYRVVSEYLRTHAVIKRDKLEEHRRFVLAALKEKMKVTYDGEDITPQLNWFGDDPWLNELATKPVEPTPALKKMIDDYEKYKKGSLTQNRTEYNKLARRAVELAESYKLPIEYYLPTDGRIKASDFPEWPEPKYETTYLKDLFGFYFAYGSEDGYLDRYPDKDTNTLLRLDTAAKAELFGSFDAAIQQLRDMAVNGDTSGSKKQVLIQRVNELMDLVGEPNYLSDLTINGAQVKVNLTLPVIFGLDTSEDAKISRYITYINDTLSLMYGKKGDIKNDDVNFPRLYMYMVAFLARTYKTDRPHGEWFSARALRHARSLSLKRAIGYNWAMLSPVTEYVNGPETSPSPETKYKRLLDTSGKGYAINFHQMTADPFIPHWIEGNNYLQREVMKLKSLPAPEGSVANTRRYNEQLASWKEKVKAWNSALSTTYAGIEDTSLFRIDENTLPQPSALTGASIVEDINEIVFDKKTNKLIITTAQPYNHTFRIGYPYYDNNNYNFSRSIVSSPFLDVTLVNGRAEISTDREPTWTHKTTFITDQNKNIVLYGRQKELVAKGDYKLVFKKTTYAPDFVVTDLRDIVILGMMRYDATGNDNLYPLTEGAKRVKDSKEYQLFQDRTVYAVSGYGHEHAHAYETLSFLYGEPRWRGLTISEILNTEGNSGTTIEVGAEEELIRQFKEALHFPAMTSDGYGVPLLDIYGKQPCDTQALADIYLSGWYKNRHGEETSFIVPKTKQALDKFKDYFRQVWFLRNKAYVNRDRNVENLRYYHNVAGNTLYGGIADNLLGNIDQVISFTEQGHPTNAIAELTFAQNEQNQTDYEAKRQAIIQDIQSFQQANGIQQTHIWYQNTDDIKPFKDSRPYPVRMQRDERGLNEFDKPINTQKWSNHLDLLLYYFNGGEDSQDGEHIRLGVNQSSLVDPHRALYKDIVTYQRQYFDSLSKGQDTTIVERALINKVDELIIALDNPVYKLDSARCISLSTLFKPYYAKSELDALGSVSAPSVTHGKLIARADQPYPDNTSLFAAKYSTERRRAYGFDNQGKLLTTPVEKVGQFSLSLDYIKGMMAYSQALNAKYEEPLKFRDVKLGLGPWTTSEAERTALNRALSDYTEKALRAGYFSLFKADIDLAVTDTKAVATAYRETYDVTFTDGNYNKAAVLFKDLPEVKVDNYTEYTALITRIATYEEDKLRYANSQRIDHPLYLRLVNEGNQLKAEVDKHNQRFNIASYYGGKYLQSKERIVLPVRRGASQEEYNELVRRVRLYDNRLNEPYPDNTDTEYNARVNLRKQLVADIDIYVAKYGYTQEDGYYISNDLRHPTRPRIYTPQELEKVRLLGERFVSVRRRLDRYKAALIPPAIRWAQQQEQDSWLKTTYENEFLPNNNLNGYGYILERRQAWDNQLNVIYNATEIVDVASIIRAERETLANDIDAYNNQVSLHARSGNNNLYPNLLNRYTELSTKINVFNDKYSLNDPTYAVYADLALKPITRPSENVGVKPLPQPLDIGKLIQYPFDHTGALPGNLVQETYVLTDENRHDFNYIIPRYAPFFSRSVVIERLDTEDGQPLRLEENRDYMFGGYFGEIIPFVTGKQRVEGLILFDDRQITGTYRVTYQTLGGQFVLDVAGYAAQIASYLENPLLTSWGEIVGKPLTFPAIPHGHDFGELTGITDVTTPIYALVEIYRQLLEAEKAQGSVVPELLEELAALRGLNRETRKEVADNVIRFQEKYEEIKRLIRDGHVVIDNSAHDADVELQLSNFRKDIVKLITDSLKRQDETVDDKIKKLNAAIDARMTELTSTINQRIDQQIAEKNLIPYSATAPEKAVPSNVLRYTTAGELLLPTVDTVLASKSADNGLTPVYRLDSQQVENQPAMTLSSPDKTKGNIPVLMKEYYYKKGNQRFKLGETVDQLVMLSTNRSQLTEIANNTPVMNTIRNIGVISYQGENGRGNIYGFRATDPNTTALYYRYPKRYLNDEFTQFETVSYLDSNSAVAMLVKGLQELDSKIETHVNRNYVLTSDVAQPGIVEAGKIVKASDDKAINGVKSLSFINGTSQVSLTTRDSGLSTDKIQANEYFVYKSGSTEKYSLPLQTNTLVEALRLKTGQNTYPVANSESALANLSSISVYNGGGSGYRLNLTEVRNRFANTIKAQGVEGEFFNLESAFGAFLLGFKDVKAFQEKMSADYNALSSKVSQLPETDKFLLKSHLNKDVGNSQFKVPVTVGAETELSSRVKLASGIVLDTTRAQLSVNNNVAAPDYYFNGNTTNGLPSMSLVSRAMSLGLFKPDIENATVQADIDLKCYNKLKTVKLTGGEGVGDGSLGLGTDSPRNSQQRKDLTLLVGNNTYFHNAYQFDAMLLGSFRHLETTMRTELDNIGNRLNLQSNESDFAEGKVVRLFTDGMLGSKGIIFTSTTSGQKHRLYKDANNEDLYYQGRFRPREINLTSDSRLKENLSPILDALNKLLSLRGYTYKFKDTDYMTAGLLAQEVQKVLPEAVSQDENGYLSLNYNAIIALLVSALSEQQEVLDEHERRLQKLEALIGKL